MLLTPPLTHVPMGLTRSIDLFTGDAGEIPLSQFLDESIVPLCNKALGHSDVLVIGCYNKFYGFFVDRSVPEGPVYSLDMMVNPDALIRVADDLQTFYNVVQLVEQAWRPYRNVDFMPQKPATRNARDSVLSYCARHAPGSVSEFWYSMAFGELSIALE